MNELIRQYTSKYQYASELTDDKLAEIVGKLNQQPVSHSATERLWNIVNN